MRIIHLVKYGYEYASRSVHTDHSRANAGGILQK